MKFLIKVKKFFCFFFDLKPYDSTTHWQDEPNAKIIKAEKKSW